MWVKAEEATEVVVEAIEEHEVGAARCPSVLFSPFSAKPLFFLW